MSYLVTEKRQTRKKALLTLLMTAGILTLFTAMSFGMVQCLTNFIEYAGAPRSLFDVIYDVFYDTILPLNGLLLCLFVSYRWKRHNLSTELSVGNSRYLNSFTEKYINLSLGTFIPAILLTIFVNTVAIKFFAFNVFDL